MTKRYAHYEPKTGRILGFYVEGLHARIPQPAVEVTEAHWRAAINNPGRWSVDHRQGGLTHADPALAGIGELRAAGMEMLAQVAEQMVAPFVAGIPAGERDGWPAKEAAARRQLTGEMTLTDERLLASEAEITGEEIADLAQAIIAKADFYRIVVGKVSGLRRRARSAILTAKTQAAIEAALTQARAGRDALIAQTEA